MDWEKRMPSAELYLMLPKIKANNIGAVYFDRTGKKNSSFSTRKLCQKHLYASQHTFLVFWRIFILATMIIIRDTHTIRMTNQ